MRGSGFFSWLVCFGGGGLMGTLVGVIIFASLSNSFLGGRAARYSTLSLLFNGEVCPENGFYGLLFLALVDYVRSPSRGSW
jgi:hypothetical protein